MNLASIYASIGPSGIALVFVGCAGLYLALRNLLYLHFVWRDFKRDFLDIEHQEGRCMRDVCDKSDNPLIAIIRDVVKTHGGHSEDIRAEVAYLFHRNFEQVTKGLCWLRLISVVSPLLGLLGTILGMVTVFRTIAENSAPNAAQLAAGIWESAHHHDHGPVRRYPHAHVLLLSDAQIQGLPYRGRGTQLPCAGTVRRRAERAETRRTCHA